MTHIPYVKLGAAPELCDISVAEADYLCRLESLLVLLRLEDIFHIYDILERLEEEGSDHRYLVELLKRYVAADKLGNGEESVRLELVHIFEYFIR